VTFNATTFAFELINFVVLVWLLNRYVFKALVSSIAERRARIAAAEAAAAAQQAAAEAAQAEMRSRSLELDRLRETILQEATADAAAERARVQQLLEAEREAALAWVRSEAVERGVDVAGHMMLSLAPEALDAALVEQLVAEIDARREALRRAAEELGEQAPEVTLVAARLPPSELRERLREALGEALGARPRLSLKEDETLLAGLVLRVGGRVLDASVAGQLAAFRDRARLHLEEAGG
jgi:F-type H+-transporting ATPase subunit b